MLLKLVPDIQMTANLVQEISLACKEQYAGADQINKALGQLDSVVQQNAAVSEQMASTAVELSSQATQLDKSIAFFQVKDGTNGKKIIPQPYVQKTNKQSAGTALEETLANPKMNEFFYKKQPSAPTEQGIHINLEDELNCDDSEFESYS